MTNPMLATAEAPTGYDATHGVVKVGTTAWSVIERVARMLKASDWFRDFKTYYFDRTASVKHPYVMIILDEENYEGIITGRSMEVSLSVWFVRAKAQSTEMEKAYTDMERFYQLLDLKPRLDDLESVDSAVVLKGKVLYGEGPQYFETITECEVRVRLHRRM